MKNVDRRVMDLGSQDLDIDDLERFRSSVLENRDSIRHEELIMFSSRSVPYQFESLESFRNDIGSIPDNASYFYFTISYPGGQRASLYLDPDRPGKTVIEGPREWVERMDRSIRTLLPQGGERYRIHQRSGVIVIWGVVLVMAVILLTITSIIWTFDPIVVSVVIFTSGILGTYLSVVEAKELQPANTISFVKKRRFWLETLLHVTTVGLGVISAILATMILRGLL